MIEGVKARYSKGAIVPLDPLDIEEGANLSLSIDIMPKGEHAGTDTEGDCLNQRLDDLYIQDYLEKSSR